MKLKSASVHHTQEVKRERRGEAHHLSDLKTGGRSEEKLLSMKKKNATIAITNINNCMVACTTNTKSLSH